jgi:hypothetical protein
VADKIVIELSLDPEISKDGKKKIEKQAGKTGEKAGKKFEKGFEKKTLNLGNTIKKSFVGLAGIVAGVGLARTFREGIRLAQIQEDAINSLNSALTISKNATIEASQGIQLYASQLQKVTRFGDEVLLQNAALIQSLGDLDENGLKRALSATTDLATALRIDLGTAATLVGKAAAGEVGTFSRYGLSIKKGSDNAETFARALTAIEQKFGGAAQRDVNTFSGRVDQLGNTFGDTLEELGFFVTKNETLLDLLKGGISVLQDFGGGLKIIRKELLGIGQSESDKPIDKVNKKLSGLARQINALVDQQKRLREGVFGFAFKEDLLQADRIQGKIQALRNQRRDALIERAKLFEERKNQNKEEIDSENEVANTIITNQQLLAQAAIQSKGLIVENAIGRFAALQSLREQDLISDFEYQQAQLQIKQETDEQLAQLDMQRRDRAIEAANDIKGATINAFKDISVSTVQLGKDLQTLALRGFGRSFQQIGAALASGENANQAFVNSVKQTGSEAASAFGDYYIKLGVARIAAGDPNGGAVLAGGLGLKVLAGALGASTGGAGGGAGGGATAFNDQTPALTDTSALQEQDIERAEPQTNVEVVVQGSLVQQDELGTFIAETLSESFGKQGVALTDARIS